MTTALQAAFAQVDAMYAHSKATVRPSDLIGSGPMTDGLNRTDMSKAQTQLEHFRSWAFVAIRAIASRIAGQAVNVGKIVEGRSARSKQTLALERSLPARYKTHAANIEPLPTHPILDLLGNPNDLTTGWGLLYVTIASLELTGKAFIWISEHGGRREAFAIPTHWVEASVGRSRIEAWKVRPPGHGEPLTIPASEMVFIAYPSPSDPKGSVSPLQAAAAAVDADESIDTAQTSAFRNGIFGTHLIIAGSLPGQTGTPHLTKTQRNQLIAPIKALYEGAHRAGTPIILDGLIKDIKPLSNRPDEMAFLDSGGMVKEKILLSFGVNAIVAGQVEGVNRASSVAAESHFCNSLNPKIELLSQAFTEWLAPMFSAPGERLVVWVDRCVARDDELRIKKWEIAARHSLITENEYRAELLGLDDIEGGDLRVGEASSFADQVSRTVADAIGDRDIFKRNGRAKVLAR